MKKCIYCNCINDDDAIYCKRCGKDISDIDELNIEFMSNENGSKVSITFAIIGYVLGFVNLSLFWFPLAFFFMVPGIVFSTLGRNCIQKNKAAFGLKLTILSMIINGIITLISAIILVIVLLNNNK